MSRRKEWLPSAPKLVRLKRLIPGESWEYYFPGWRSVYPMLWHVHKKENNRYEVTCRDHMDRTMLSKLSTVRMWIAQHYEYLPKP